MQGVSTLFRFTCATLVLCVWSFGTVFGRDVESLAYPRSGALGIWSEVSALGSRSFEIDEQGEIVEYKESAEPTSERDFGVFRSLRAFGEVREEISSQALFRGQVAPPTESPTSSTTISSSGSSLASSSATVPPASLDDRPFTPQTSNSTNEETTFQRVFKNSQDFSASVLYMTASKAPDVNGKPTMRNMEIDARILFACPCANSSINNGYFLVTPSFKYTRMQTYKSASGSLSEFYSYLFNYDLTDEESRRVYEASCSLYDFGLTGTLETTLRDLEVHGDLTLGMASSFKDKLTCDSFYIRGRLVGELPVDSTKEVKIVGGATYYGRVRYKVLPVLGFVWKPNLQNELRVVYPNPRWSHFLTKVNGTDWWFYVHGELGGGNWTYKTDKFGKVSFDNNDYRVGLGVSFDCSSNLMGSAEIGGAFDRELRAKVNGRKEALPLKDAFYFKFGVLF